MLFPNPFKFFDLAHMVSEIQSIFMLMIIPYIVLSVLKDLCILSKHRYQKPDGSDILLTLESLNENFKLDMKN